MEVWILCRDWQTVEKTEKHTGLIGHKWAKGRSQRCYYNSKSHWAAETKLRGEELPEVTCIGRGRANYKYFPFLFFLCYLLWVCFLFKIFTKLIAFECLALFSWKTFFLLFFFKELLKEKETHPCCEWNKDFFSLEQFQKTGNNEELKKLHYNRLDVRSNDNDMCFIQMSVK